MKIEEGKFYLNRGGVVVGPMRKTRVPYQSEHSWDAVVAGELQAFMSDGSFGPAGGRIDTRDLVQEYTGMVIRDNFSSSLLVSEPPYASLQGTLQMALDQAATGKGHERHGGDKPFLDQPIMEIARMLGGTDGHAYQIIKKAQEANRMVSREQYDAAVAEYLGVINYAAAAILLIREL